jgi:hypothetical protein
MICYKGLTQVQHAYINDTTQLGSAPLLPSSSAATRAASARMPTIPQPLQP